MELAKKGFIGMYYVTFHITYFGKDSPATFSAYCMPWQIIVFVTSDCTEVLLYCIIFLF